MCMKGAVSVGPDRPFLLGQTERIREGQREEEACLPVFLPPSRSFCAGRNAAADEATDGDWRLEREGSAAQSLRVRGGNGGVEWREREERDARRGEARERRVGASPPPPSVRRSLVPRSCASVGRSVGPVRVVTRQGGREEGQRRGSKSSRRREWSERASERADGVEWSGQTEWSGLERKGRRERERERETTDGTETEGGSRADMTRQSVRSRQAHDGHTDTVSQSAEHRTGEEKLGSAVNTEGEREKRKRDTHTHTYVHTQVKEKKRETVGTEVTTERNGRTDGRSRYMSAGRVCGLCLSVRLRPSIP